MNHVEEAGPRSVRISAPETKKALIAAGLEIYRTRGEIVYLADRVRENLLMDAGAFVRGGESIRVGVLVRAQASDFPGEDVDQLFTRARTIAVQAIVAGYTEVDAQLHRVLDPGDAEKTLDTWCEVQLEKPVADLDAAVDEVRRAIAFLKAVSR